MKEEKDYFKVGKNNIGYVGDNFKNNFLDMDFEIPEKLELKTKILERNMNDREILEEFKPKESNLGELVYGLKSEVLLKNGYANIFYIRDKNDVLWAVSAYWRSGGRCWSLGAYSVGDPRDWRAGDQVVSRDWNFEFKTSDTLTLSNSEPVKVLELEYKGYKYRIIE